jgi:hypothetical protein
VTFWLAYGDQSTLKPMIKHLSTVSDQLTQVQRELQHVRPPPIDPHHLAEIVAKEVMEQLIPLVIPPKRRSWVRRLLYRD